MDVQSGHIGCLRRLAQDGSRHVVDSVCRFLRIALISDIVMSAILALSASHLAWSTKNQHTEQLAYHHRGIALKGLHEAIGGFSRENSEAILTASILLSWQATEW